MAAENDATAYSYQNIGFLGAPMRDAVHSTYQNIGFFGEPVRDAIHTAHQNIGFFGAPSGGATVTSYENIGLQAEVPQILVRQPRGWGFIPNTSQTILVLQKGSSATVSAYENIVDL